MSKKMKGVLLDPSPCGAYGDAKTRLKHQALMQDYLELQKEAEGMRNKLVTMKQKKLTLLAEVSFLQQRHKVLMKSRSSEPPKQRDLVKQQNFDIKPKNIRKERIHDRKERTMQNLAPNLDLNQKGRIFSGKEAAHQNTTPVFDLNQKGRIYGRRRPHLRSPIPIVDFNQKESVHGGKQATFEKQTMAFELKPKERIHCTKEGSWKTEAPFSNQKERVYSGKEVFVQNQAPIFDLNQISRDEEAFEGGCKTLEVEEPTNDLIGGSDEQLNELRLSICRNVGSGPSTAGKRKISWQDQVALRV